MNNTTSDYVEKADEQSSNTMTETRTGSSPSVHIVHTTETTISTTTETMEVPLPSGMPQKPINFGTVAPGLYRSGYPQTENHEFLQSLKLKTIVTLVSKEMPEGYGKFMEANGITHRIFGMAGTKKEVISLEMMQDILEVVTDSANYPLLIHCNHGKHRTGCVVGLVRKASEWEVGAIVQEYTQFAAPKVRETDVEYLTKFKALDLEKAKSKLVTTTKTTIATRTTVDIHTRPGPPPVTLGNFVFFVLLAGIALCIFVFTGRNFLREQPATPPLPPRRREMPDQ